jgi:anaerobic magnesium-protoporphyrin IX monomethyl ester cyclase
MRITLLEHPREPSPAHYNDIANTPLWACLMTGYAGAALARAEFAVEIVDASRWAFPETLQYLKDHPADLLAVHAVYFWEETAKLFHLLTELRRQHYEAPICLYGFFPSLTWQDILEHYPDIDYVIVGEPEETLVDLARSLQAGAVAPVNGLALRGRAGEIMFTDRRPPIDPLDRLPFPLRPGLRNEDTVSILASRGCYNCCSFCLIPTLNGGKPSWRSRSPENVVAEITELMAYGKTDFYFVDPNFIGPGKAGKEQALTLAHRLAELDITFGMESRANDLTPDLMRTLAQAGLTSLLLGIESGSPRILRRLSKHTNIAQNEQAIALVREVGLEPEVGFIMFDVDSTLDDVTENLNFLKRTQLLRILGRTANLLYHDHIAFKGSGGYQTALHQGRLQPQGIFGFEGRLLYQDYRVGWLAGLMKPLCQSVLREMGSPSSGIYYKREVPGKDPYQAVNDHLVEIFQQLLDLAATLTELPPATRSQELRLRLEDELRRTLAQAPPRGHAEHVNVIRSC